MRFGRGNLRGGNLIVETLILPHFLRLPRQTEVVTRCEKSLILPHFLRLPHSAEVVTYEVTILARCLSTYIIARYRNHQYILIQENIPMINHMYYRVYICSKSHVYLPYILVRRLIIRP